MNHDNWIVPPDCAKLIYNLAPLSFISSFVGFYNGHYDLCIVPFSVGCSTLLYWKKPISGWRRNVDICISSCGLLYQMYVIYTLEQYIISYYFCKVLAVSSYFIGHYYFAKGHLWPSMYWHAGVHIFGNIGNAILYCLL